MGEGRMSMGELSGTEVFFENSTFSLPVVSQSPLSPKISAYAIDYSLSWTM